MGAECTSDGHISVEKRGLHSGGKYSSLGATILDWTDRMSSPDESLEPFVPHNDLEQKLIAAQEGSIPGEDFMHYVLTAQLFMPVQDEKHVIKGFQRDDKAVPLTLETEDGMQVLVLFTSPERAKPFLENYANFTGGILAELSWILERVGSGYGVAINPGWSVGIDMDPEMVDQMVGR